MGLRPCPYLLKLNERQTADLIYRENSRIKHSQSKRLADEIADKARELPVATAPNQLQLPSHSSELTKALVDHLRDICLKKAGSFKKIIFAAKQEWVKDMLFALPSSFALPGPSAGRRAEDLAAASAIQDWLTTLEDESMQLPQSLALMPVHRTDVSHDHSFQYMAGSSEAKVVSVTHTCATVGSEQKFQAGTDSDAWVYFTVVSENMNSYTLLGAQSAKYDLMVHPYFPVRDDTAEAGFVLVPYGVTQGISFSDQSFQSLGQSLSVWQSKSSRYVLCGSNAARSRL